MNTRIKVQYSVVEKGKFGNGDIEFSGQFVKIHSFRPTAGDFVRLHLEDGVRMCRITQCVIMDINPQVVDILAYCEKVE